MIFASQFVTADGIASDPELWHAEFASEESDARLVAELASADEHLLGRRTFEELASFWPSVPSSVTVADPTNTLAKRVVSTTLESAEWGEGVERADIALATAQVSRSLDEIPDDRTLMLSGSLELMQSLLRVGRLDAVHLYLDPVVRGEGRSLFGDVAARLELTMSEALPHGMLYLEYDVVR